MVTQPDKELSVISGDLKKSTIEKDEFEYKYPPTNIFKHGKMDEAGRNQHPEYTDDTKDNQLYKSTTNCKLTGEKTQLPLLSEIVIQRNTPSTAAGQRKKDRNEIIKVIRPQEIVQSSENVGSISTQQAINQGSSEHGSSYVSGVKNQRKAIFKKISSKNS